MTASSAPGRVRIDSVDLLRGLIMIIMALDHVRDYFGDLAVNPTNLAATTIPLFFTRWITHICAPVFFLLTGTGAYLTLRRMSRAELSRFLLSRGLWLILLEVTVLRFLFQFNLDYRVTILTVLWALGWSMVCLSGLLHLGAPAATVIGVIMIAGHNLLDGVQAASLGALAPLWNILHSPGFVLNGPDHVALVAYPLIPWIGVTAVGYGLGQTFEWEAVRRRKFLLWTGLAGTLGFVLLRTLNLYGDPARWAVQPSGAFTVLSYLNTSKYPPSLLFLLMTLGPSLLLLRWLDGGTPWLLRPALVIGRVPLFYFLTHFLLVHLLAVVVSVVRYGDAAGMFQSPTLDRFPITQPPGWPLGLPAVYLIWIGVVLALYPLCRWFAGLRRRRSDRWLSYL